MNPAEQPPAGSHEALRKAAYNALAMLKVQRAIAFTTAFDSTITELEEALGMTKKGPK